MGKFFIPPTEISVELGEISPSGMKNFPYEHTHPAYRDEISFIIIIENI